MLDALRRLSVCLSVLPPILRGKLQRRRHGDEQNRDVGKAGYAECKASLSPFGCFSHGSVRVKDGETQGGVSGCPPERNYMQLHSDTRLFFSRPRCHLVCLLSYDACWLRHKTHEVP